MNISRHAKQRMKERCGFNPKSQLKMVRKAFNEGITHAQTQGRLHKWITRRYHKNRKANNIRLYGDKAYIFCGETLVTVIPVPVEIMENMNEMIRR